MRVGLVCPYDLSRPGGVQAQVMGLARALEQVGDTATIMAPGLPEGLQGVDLGSTVSVPGNRSVMPLSLDPRVIGAIRDASAELDLLHVHEPLMPTVSLSALRAGRPVVATFHAAPGTFGIGFYTVLRRQIGRLLGDNVRRVTAVSATAAAPLPEELDVALVPNGVDVAAFTVETERVHTRVAFLGRDEKRKGLDVLLEAWEVVTRSVPEADLVVMGADRGHEGITWLGTVDDATKVEILNSAAIYVAPNLGGESFGVVLVEAMASGAAVLASDLGSFRDVGGDAARYFATGSARELATQMIDMLGDQSAVGELSAAGTERARRFDWAKVVADYRVVYHQALS